MRAAGKYQFVDLNKLVCISSPSQLVSNAYKLESLLVGVSK